MTTPPPASPSPNNSRRDFLKASTAALGAGALLSGCGSTSNSSAAPSASPAAFMPRTDVPMDAVSTGTLPNPLPPPVAADAKVLKIGVIGLGADGACAMGLNHARSLVDLSKQGKEKLQIVAICDLCTIHLEAAHKDLLERQPDVAIKTYTKHEDLLKHRGLDGVVIATPEHAHAHIAIDAIKAGKDVYLEKPMTLQLDEAIALFNVAKAHPNVMAQVGTQQTRMPKFHEARKLIQAGAIGTPTFSQTSYCRNSKNGEWHYPINKDWKPGVNLDWERWCGPLGSMPWDPKLYYQWRRYHIASTGIIGDLLVHVMTPMMMAIDQGWPVRVSATGGHLVDKAMDNPDNINIVAQFETGHQMMVAGSTCNEVGLETLIRGHKGNIYLGSRHCTVRPERIFVEEMEEKTVECPDIGNDQDVHRLGWLHSIRTREKPFSSIELGLKVMVVVALAQRSIWEGGAWSFDPSTMKAARA
ncbi:MAG TPA: Gfo/Idh/MocA family oxidoreductase [Phycisphaerales bacterium]|nr:Gfo/Idh/MocA family oxidoreductase [Phycisphaerales bacterium]